MYTIARAFLERRRHDGENGHRISYECIYVVINIGKVNSRKRKDDGDGGDERDRAQQVRMVHKDTQNYGYVLHDVRRAQTTIEQGVHAVYIERNEKYWEKKNEDAPRYLGSTTGLWARDVLNLNH